MNKKNFSRRLCLNDLPLWRLLVALDDAERSVGPNSPTAQVLARVVKERLEQDCGDSSPKHEEKGESDAR
jgi:hypothetical protein